MLTPRTLTRTISYGGATPVDSLKLYATSSRNEVSRMGELQFSVWAVETFAETVLTPNDLIELLGLHPRPSPLPPC